MEPPFLFCAGVLFIVLKSEILRGLTMIEAPVFPREDATVAIILSFWIELLALCARRFWTTSILVYSLLFEYGGAIILGI